MTVYGDSARGSGGTDVRDHEPATTNGTDSIGSVQEKISGAASEAADRVSTTVSSEVDQRSTDAGEKLASVAERGREVGSELRSDGNETVARLVEGAASYTDRLSQYLRDGDAQKILGDVEAYARRQPWAVVIGGVVVGFAASRMLRASRPTEDSRPSSSYPSTYPSSDYASATYPSTDAAGYASASSSADYPPASTQPAGRPPAERAYGDI